MLLVISVVINRPGTLSKLTIIEFLLGKVAMEGKVEHKFDMKPHGENIEEYGRLCRERTNKSMIKNRQIQVTFIVYYLIDCSLDGFWLLAYMQDEKLSMILFTRFYWKVIDNDRGVLMRPMPGMVGLVSANSKVSFFHTLLYVEQYAHNIRFSNRIKFVWWSVEILWTTRSS